MKASRAAEEEEVAVIYAQWLRDGKAHDWRSMNEAIIERWSITALGRIKRRAWEIAK